MPYSQDFFHENITEIHKYKVVERMYCHNATQIFKVQDNNHNYFAVKMLHRDASSKSLMRFQREISVLQKLNYVSRTPNIYASGKMNENPYYVMDYIEGASLKEYIYNQKKIPEKEALEIIKNIAFVVNQIHEKEIFHRDLSPKNIILSKNTAYIIDFGIAFIPDDLKISQTGECLGTVNYMSPEQANGDFKHIGPWSDIFSLGCILYHMMAGIPPFYAPKDVMTLANLAQNKKNPIEKYSPNISKASKFIFMKTLSPEIEKRYQQVNDLIADITSAKSLIIDPDEDTFYLNDNSFLAKNTKKNIHIPKKKRYQRPPKKSLRKQNSQSMMYIALSMLAGLLFASFLLLPFVNNKTNTKPKVKFKNLVDKKTKNKTQEKKKIAFQQDDHFQSKEEIKPTNTSQQLWHVPQKISSRFYAKWTQENNMWVGRVDRPFGLMQISDFPEWKNYEFKADILIEQGLLGIFVRNFHPTSQFPNFLGQMGIQNFQKRWFSVTTRVYEEKITISLDNTDKQLVRFNKANINPGILGFGLTVARNNIPALVYVKNMRIRKLTKE